MHSPRRSLKWMALVLLGATTALAGGGGMNVMVLYNGNNPDATRIAQHYATARQLPTGHLCAITAFPSSIFHPDSTNLSLSDFLTKVRQPLDACLAALPEASQVDYLVLVRGLPYGAAGVSMEAALQLGHAQTVSDGGELLGKSPEAANPLFQQGSNYAAYRISNPYEGSYTSATEIPLLDHLQPSFRRATAPMSYQADYRGNLFIVSSLDGLNYDDADALVGRSVASDGTFPKAELLCMASSDAARGARDPECEYLTRVMGDAGFKTTWVPIYDPALKGHEVAAYFTGSYGLQGAIDGNTYVPGAMVDVITSYAGAASNFCLPGTCPVADCPTGNTCGGESQFSIARFIHAGATGAEGTVNEPYNNAFPNAGAIMYYTYGYNMGESYFFNQANIYWQNHYLGDPLATPYATRPVVSIGGAGMPHPVNLPVTVHASHPNGIAETLLYVNGVPVVTDGGADLQYLPTWSMGQTVEVYAAAVAQNAPVMRPGWPTPSVLAQPDVQGWTLERMTISAAEIDAGHGTGGGGTADGGGGAGVVGGGLLPVRGCGASPVGPAGGVISFAALALALLLRRRSA